MRCADSGRKSKRMVKTDFQDGLSGGGGQDLPQAGAQRQRRHLPGRFSVPRRIEKKTEYIPSFSHAKWVWTLPWGRHRYLPWLGPVRYG